MERKSEASPVRRKGGLRSMMERPEAKKAGKLLHYLLLVGIIGLLIYQVTRIGWSDVLGSLPTHPLFYIIFFVIFLSLPINEYAIYRLIWRIPFVSGMLALLKKRVFNKDVLGFSGEVYLFVWVEREMGVRRDRAWKIIKDNAIVSSMASTFFAVVVLAVLLLSGQILIAQHFIEYDVTYVIAAVIVSAILGALGYRFRRWIFLLPLSTLALIFGLHVLRLGATSGLQLVQWAVVIPELSWSVWFTLLALMIVTSRIPLLPARDLAFISLAVEVSTLMGVASAPIVAMLLVNSALDKGMNLLSFVLASIHGDKVRKELDGRLPTEAADLTGARSHAAP